MVWSYTISPDIYEGNCFCPPNTKLFKVDFSQNKDGTTTYNHIDYILDLAYGFTVWVKPGPGGEEVTQPRIFDSNLSGTQDPD